MKMNTVFFALLPALVLTFLQCDEGGQGFIYDDYDDGDWYSLNELFPKDSAAVRALMDANGLKGKAIGDVIKAQGGAAVKMTLDSLHSTRLVLTKALDSCVSDFQIVVQNSDVETLSIADTIHLARLWIQINHTKLREIPGRISWIKGRFSLYLSYNELCSISPEIMKCDVRGIDVRSNALCSLSDSVNAWVTKHDIFQNADWQSTQRCE